MIIDEDLFVMAIASEMRCISSHEKSLFKQRDLVFLDDIADMTERTIAARLKEGEGFLFDIG